ncbi:MAG: MarR family transcriptional regulator [Candidatus Obscuribacterales bacterium]|nr:MarR family transcriptional regulator [Candidatus Obscuribacterales bacterium]
MTPNFDSGSIPTSLRNPGFLLNQSARIVAQMVGDCLSPMKLQTQEFGLLRILSIYGPINQQSFASKYNMDRTTVTQLVDGLENRDYVIREKNPLDRRENLLHLTPSGKRVFTRAARAVKARQKEFLTPLSNAEWEQLQELLVRLIEFHVTTDKG